LHDYVYETLFLCGVHAAAEEANRFGTRKTRVSREFPCKNVLVIIKLNLQEVEGRKDKKEIIHSE